MVSIVSGQSSRLARMTLGHCSCYRVPIRATELASILVAGWSCCVVGIRMAIMSQNQWKDPVGTLIKLQTCVRHLMDHQDTPRSRWTKATDPLVGLEPPDFPERLRSRATRVLGARGSVAHEYLSSPLYHFERLNPGQRAELKTDILALYTACLIDIGKLGEYDDMIYPEDH